MQTDREQLLERFDRILIEAVQDAQEGCCAESVYFPEQHRNLPEQAKCAMIFLKQWASDAGLPLDLNDLDTILILGFERSSMKGDHVHDRILQGLIHLTSRPEDHTHEVARVALVRINSALTPAHHELISSAKDALIKVMILLGVDPDEQSLQTASFLLAKLLDPDLGT